MARARAFTLTELLIVLALMLVLLSMLLPAIGSVRRAARISGCTSNMKQHGVGMLNHAAANGGALPNGPHERRRGIHHRFATADDPVNGFGWGVDGMYTLTSVGGGEILNRTVLDEHSSMHDLYWVVLSEYMVDGEGIAAMQDVFVSPSDNVTPGWWANLVNFVRENHGDFPETAQAQAPAVMGGQGSPGSYRYAISAMVNPKVLLRSPRTGEFADPSYSGHVALPTTLAIAGEQDFRHFIRRNRTADVDHPSSKVLFYMYNAWHDADLDVWFQQGAAVPVCLADGSARSTEPYQEGIPANERENAGPVWDFFFHGEPDITWPGHYFLNNGGIKGRDL